MTRKRTRQEKIESGYSQSHQQSHHKTELKEYVTLSYEQRKLCESIRKNSITLVSGNAGTGKTLISLQTLYQLLKANQINQILVVRLILESEEEAIGALPGDDLQKLAPYLMPIMDNLEQFLPLGEVKYLIREEIVKILPYSYIRGRSFHNKGIIVEEAQNLKENQIMTIATRIARGSKIVFNGDDYQADLIGRAGITYLTRLLSDIPDIGVIQFKDKEIPRHPLIAELIQRKQEMEEKKEEYQLNTRKKLLPIPPA